MCSWGTILAAKQPEEGEGEEEPAGEELGEEEEADEDDCACPDPGGHAPRVNCTIPRCCEIAVALTAPLIAQ